MTPDGLSGILIGESPPLRRLRELIVRIAPSGASVLIQGPTGSGKELVAEALHLASGRRGTFVPVNVCAINASMFEDALFGHVRGAFTGAFSDAQGYFREGDGGTVFLDEISSLPLAMQPVLLRAIETKRFRPVGALKDVASAFRLLSASNESLAALVGRGDFRADLLERLSAFVLSVVPLCERVEDIPLLVRHLVVKELGDPPSRVTETALRALQTHDWPGNVRELRNVLVRAAALAGHAEIDAGHIGEAMGMISGRAIASPRAAEERSRVLQLITEANWDIQLAARRAGVHRTTVYRWMARLRIPRSRQRTAID